MKAPLHPQPRPLLVRDRAAFTLVEIALSLAVIAFALVAIIGVLPSGLTVQRENREETIINQDASVFLSAIRNGARGYDDLTNYVYAVSNYITYYSVPTNAAGPVSTNFGRSDVNWFVNKYNGGAGFNATVWPDNPRYGLFNGTNIIGVISTPKYMTATGSDAPGYYSNFVVAYVRAISGLAAEKPPQDNPDVRVDSFAYRVICENQAAPAYVEPTNALNQTSEFTKQLTNNLRELRLTFRWPINFQGVAGNGRQTYRQEMAGYLFNEPAGSPLWRMLPNTYYNTTNLP